MAIVRNLNEDNDSNNSNVDRRISKKIDILDKKMDALYRDINVSRPDNRKNLDDILGKLDNTIDNINAGELTLGGMSELLRRIDNKTSSNSNVDQLNSSVAELFEDSNLIGNLFNNQNLLKFVSARNYQFDMICKYIPKILDALEIKRDNVLCSDNFEKKFLNPECNKFSKQEVEKFSSNVKKLETNYELSEFLEKTYMNTSIYGEDFIYIVKYDEALKRLIDRGKLRKNGAKLSAGTFYESTSINPKNKVTILKENYIRSEEFKKFKSENLDLLESFEDNEKFKGFEVTLHFNDSNIINSSINDRLVLENKSEIEQFMSMTETMFYGEAVNGDLDEQLKDINKQNNKLSAAANDGLIIPGSLSNDTTKIDKNLCGAVVERLAPDAVLPIYIGNRCFGYYYLEIKEHDGTECGYCGGNHMTPGISNALNYQHTASQDQQELAIRYISGKISQSIDNKFINANKDLKKEIYSILRFNEKFDINRSNDIGVTFIPAEDIVHCYFNIDETTHRGISDIQKSVVPALLYILLYLTDIIGKITRSTDKRVYYVKQNVETNISRTMMNVVGQIKKGNFGMRQIESMNNILNIVGKYNDFIIPVGQSGDSPISFEVMQGQDIQTPSEIMEKMEEAAINATGVPLEMLNSIYQQDFAVRFSMTNVRFLKTINTRQRLTEKFFSKIYTKIYNYEYNENNSSIQIKLPPPVYLTSQNNQQIIDNIVQQADKYIEIFLYDKSDEVKNQFKKNFVKNKLPSYIDFAEIELLISTSEIEIESKKNPTTQDGGNSDIDTGGYDEY